MSEIGVWELESRFGKTALADRVALAAVVFCSRRLNNYLCSLSTPPSCCPLISNLAFFVSQSTQMYYLRDLYLVAQNFCFLLDNGCPSWIPYERDRHTSRLVRSMDYRDLPWSWQCLRSITILHTGCMRSRLNGISRGGFKLKLADARGRKDNTTASNNIKNRGSASVLVSVCLYASGDLSRVRLEIHVWVNSGQRGTKHDDGRSNRTRQTVVAH